MERVLSLGNIYISTFTETSRGHIGKAPLTLVHCLKCDLVQLADTAPQELLYTGKYWYKSGINKVIVDDLKDIVSKGLKHHSKGTWIDIGANDGTLLSFVPSHFNRVAVEPAKNFKNDLALYERVPKFWEKVKLKYKANVITAIGMFYDSDNPNLFIKNVKDHLMDDGVFIAQLMTLAPMCEKNDLGNICHEHLEYYSYKSLVYLFESNGLEIFRVEGNDINGGSYRLYARHFKKGSVEIIERSNLALFARRIIENREKTIKFIREQILKGKKVYGYGASTKGNTILQYYNLDNRMITAVADKNTEKIGKYMVRTKIPIVSEKEAREKADFFFILPWGFTDHFLKLESEWRKKGGKFIVSIPSFKIL